MSPEFIPHSRHHARDLGRARHCHCLEDTHHNRKYVKTAQVAWGPHWKKTEEPNGDQGSLLGGGTLSLVLKESASHRGQKCKEIKVSPETASAMFFWSMWFEQK